MADRNALRSLYEGLSPNPDSDYGTYLPFAKNREGSADWVAQGNNTRFAMPNALRDSLTGGLDALRSTETGSLTPNALATLTLGSVGAGIMGAPRGALAAGAARPPAARSLADVTAGWDASGIDHALSEGNGIITLSKIVVPKENREKGLGTSAMQALADYADATGQRIALTPSSDFGGNKARLIDFYKAQGFVENKGRNKDFTTRETMIRDPREGPVY